MYLQCTMRPVLTCTETLQAIKALGMKAGVSLNPHTPVSVLEDVITDIDLVLIMSVNPGFGGQKFIPQAIDKVRKVKKMITDSGSKALIEIDGGVTVENAPELVAAGSRCVSSRQYCVSHQIILLRQ